MDMEAAVRKLGGVWPLIKELNPVDDKPGALFISGSRLFVSKGLNNGYRLIGTRKEFDATTARLRNEPSFDGAPDWVKAKAQDDNGEWYYFADVPRVRAGRTAFNYGGMYVRAGKGEVIGDWKQTLRLRPEEKKMEENSVRYSLFGNSLARRWARVKRLKEMAVEAERNRRESEVPSESDNDWHQRGEFPPVGTVCEVLYDDVWEQTKIIGWNDDAIVITTEWDDTYSYDGLLAEPSMFRPLQTERERLLESAYNAVKNAHNPYTAVSLLGWAGMLKMPEEK